MKRKSIKDFLHGREAVIFKDMWRASSVCFDENQSSKQSAILSASHALDELTVVPADLECITEEEGGSWITKLQNSEFPIDLLRAKSQKIYQDKSLEPGCLLKKKESGNCITDISPRSSSRRNIDCNQAPIQSILKREMSLTANKSSSSVYPLPGRSSSPLSSVCTECNTQMLRKSLYNKVKAFYFTHLPC